MENLLKNFEFDFADNTGSLDTDFDLTVDYSSLTFAAGSSLSLIVDCYFAFDCWFEPMLVGKVDPCLFTIVLDSERY